MLLHEAAHSLGLEHTADAHALMASTLQPGVRRLPSPELLAELQQLSTNSDLASVNTIDSHDPSPLPNAPLPLGIGFTAFWMGRMRKDGLGYAFEPQSSSAPQTPQYEVAPNPTLLNPEFAGNDGWNTTGTVTFGNTAAVLTESATAQTRLNQLFARKKGSGLAI